MKYSIQTLVIFFVALSSICAQSSDKEITDKFFSIFETNPIAAMDYAFSTNEWIQQNMEAVENVKTKFNDILPLIGSYRGFEQIRNVELGTRFKRQSFMARYDRQPIRFIFTFYKPDSIWRVQNLKWDVDLDAEFEK